MKSIALYPALLLLLLLLAQMMMMTIIIKGGTWGQFLPLNIIAHQHRAQLKLLIVPYSTHGPTAYHSSV